MDLMIRTHLFLKIVFISGGIIQVQSCSLLLDFYFQNVCMYYNQMLSIIVIYLIGLYYRN